MDPKQLFFDERLMVGCAYCGGEPLTRDHVPSKVLLDEPYPPDLPVICACERCNASFSMDEQYLACIVECALTGTAQPNGVGREKIRRILCDNPALAALVAESRNQDDRGNAYWEPNVDRVRNVVLKLARGHVAYELGSPQLGRQHRIWFTPFPAMSPTERRMFESMPGSNLWPEIGSRAFLRAFRNRSAAQQTEQLQQDQWLIVQPGRYRYLASPDGRFVRVVLSEYLACEVAWG